MSRVESKVESLTDWARVARDDDSDVPIPYDPENGPYDPNDGAAVEVYWDKATVIFQGKVIQQGTSGPEPELQPVTLKLSPEVVECFRSLGDDWEVRINETLKRAVGL